MPKYKFSVGACFKNEAHILVEWVEHYLAHGAEHIYLVNDGSTDNYEDILKLYIIQGVVTLIENDIKWDSSQGSGRQTAICSRHIVPHMLHSKWFAFLDLDEFLYCPSGPDDITVALDKCEDVAQILVDWVHFGSNGHKEQPPSVVEGFTRRAFLTTSTDKYYSYKAIVQSTMFLEYGIHGCNVTGKTMRMSWSNTVNNLSPQFVINHYSIQSEAYWMSVKMVRGDINRWHKTEARNLEWFHDFDRNEEDDTTLRDANERLGVTAKTKSAKLENGVTVVVTACNRPNLLERTMKSFLKFNTHPIARFIIIEDSGAQDINDGSRQLIAEHGKGATCDLIYNKTNLGQIQSIDIAYSYVRTKWIFHLEEDWEFYRGGFIEKSMEILEKDPTVVTVWLRAHKNGFIHENGHPVDQTLDMGGYYFMLRNYANHWDGFTFNPGLRRMTDYKKVAPFMESCKPYHHKYTAGEWDCSTVYTRLGMRGATPVDGEGYIYHIGWGQHIPRQWDGQ